MSSSSNSVSSSFKSGSYDKIPPFDEQNFTMWKSRAITVLESMDYPMFEIITKGPSVPMNQPVNNNVAVGEKQKKEEHNFDDNDKRLLNMDVRSRSAICNALPYNIYHIVQNEKTAKSMLDTLTIAFEGTPEVIETIKNNLNRKYELLCSKE